MNIDATEENLRTATEALKLAAILDDRAPRADKARIAAWAEKIHKHNLTRTDVLDGLQAFYDSPSERAIQIGDLIHHARIVKRARLDKESDDERDRRRAEVDIKAADETPALMADAVMVRVKRTPRLAAAEAALKNAKGRQQAMAAIREFFAAKTEAPKLKQKARK